MKKLLLSIIAVASCVLFQDAYACRGPYPKPISSEEAFTKAEAVFLGKVVDIKEGFPVDFRPENAKEYNDRVRNFASQAKGNGKVGRTIVFEPIKTWKGDRPSPIVFVEVYAQDTCEWNYDVQLNDEFIVYASHYGNYPTLPSVMFDGRGAYTKYNPSKRKNSPEHFANAVADEQKTFDRILNDLSRQHTAKTGAN